MFFEESYLNCIPNFLKALELEVLQGPVLMILIAIHNMAIAILKRRTSDYRFSVKNEFNQPRVGVGQCES